MTRRTNARIAGFTFLFYIAAGIAAMILFGRAAGAEGTAAKLARIAEHATDMHVAILLTLFTCFMAIVLAVTLYAITRDQDPDLAMIALACRFGEGILNAIFILTKLEVLWLATAAGGNAPDTAAANALGAFVLTAPRVWNTTITATFFAVGSTLFSWLLLRGRMIPAPMAWLGVVASALLVVGLPLQLAGAIRSPVTDLMWIPMLAFEVPLGLWLIIKGVATPAPRRIPAADGAGSQPS